MQDLLSFSEHLADTAGGIIRQYFRQPFEVEAKGDETPVTIADKTVEAALRAIIEREYPDDGILGEEYGPKETRNGRTWVLDPIDGTKSFVVGRPTFGTLIALCENDIPVLGVIDQPVSGERWMGANGMPTTFNGAPVKTRPCANLKSARCASTSPSQLPDLWQKIDKQTNIFVWGGDCYSYGLMANGGIDVVIEQFLAPYDFAALVPIVNGAGGHMCDWKGNPLTITSNGQTVAMGDIALKEKLLEILAS